MGAVTSNCGSNEMNVKDIEQWLLWLLGCTYQSCSIPLLVLIVRLMHASVCIASYAYYVRHGERYSLTRPYVAASSRVGGEMHVMVGIKHLCRPPTSV